MRVVGGVWRGRPLTAPAGRGTRPTSDKVREAIFDVLGALPEVRDAVVAPAQAERTPPIPAGGAAPPGPLAGHAVLDLFAGSGALGIEALSRGAASCTFVESAPAALRALRANLARLGVPVERPSATSAVPPPRAVVLAADVRRALAADARRGARYTLVLADPPYDLYEQIRPAFARLLGRLLAPGAVLVVESAAGGAAGLPWGVLRDKRYGDTRVTFLAADALAPEEGEPAD